MTYLPKVPLLVSDTGGAIMGKDDIPHSLSFLLFSPPPTSHCSIMYFFCVFIFFFQRWALMSWFRKPTSSPQPPAFSSRGLCRSLL